MSVYWFLLAASFLLSSCSASVVQKTTEWQVQRTGGIDLPIYRHKTRSFRRRGSTGSIGLGDSVDMYVILPGFFVIVAIYQIQNVQCSYDSGREFYACCSW